MNGLHLFLSAFFLVFIAELGDKTQIAGFSLAAESGETLSVFLGASGALVCSTLLAVLLGHKLTCFIPRRILKIVSGALFILTGAYILVRAVMKL